jgi:hypothetical protein
VVVDGFNLVPRIADYLPADLLAAPAYAEVGFIVTTMSLIGAEIRTKADDNYPSMKGTGCQFDIRQHATLGLIGSFSDYEPIRKGNKTFDQKQVLNTLNVSFGVLRLVVRYRRGSSRKTRKITYNANVWDRVEDEHRFRLDYYRLWKSPLYFFPLHLLISETPSFTIDVFPWGKLHHRWQTSLVVMDSIRPFRPLLSITQDYRQDAHLQAQMLETVDNSCAICDGSNTHFSCHVLREACLMMIQGVAQFSKWRATVPFSRLVSLRMETLQQMGFLDQWIRSKKSELGLDTNESESDLDANGSYKLFKITATAFNVIQAFDPEMDLLKSTPDLLKRSTMALAKFAEAFPTKKVPQSLERTLFTDNEQRHAFDRLERLFDPELDMLEGEERQKALLRRLVDFQAWWEGRDPARGLIKYAELLLRNVIIWRATLVAVLFCLANDNTALLDSGVWHDIIPIM